MADPVKTTLLKTLEMLLQEWLPGVTIKRDWFFPLDLGTMNLPALLFYEDLEDSPKGSNRISRNVLHLDLAYFGAFSEPVFDANSPAWQTFKEAADLLAAQLHALWWDEGSRLALKAAGLLQVVEVGNRKAPCNQTYGEMVLTVRLTYGHNLGDAFSLVPAGAPALLPAGYFEPGYFA